MGLLSGTSADPDVTSSGARKSTDSRWLFPLRRFEEELLEHILMSAGSGCHPPWSGRKSSASKDSNAGVQQQCSSGVKERQGVTDVVQRKFEKLGKNVACKVKVLKQALKSEASDKSAADKDVTGPTRDECRKVACNEIVRATLHRHPGSQLPDVFVSSLQAHFESLPNSYARAGFNSEQVFMHIRLLEQVKAQQPNVPAVQLQAADCMSRSNQGSEFSSSSSSPSSSVWDDNDRSLMDEVVDVSFACSSSVSKPALVWAFEHEMITVRQATVFERKNVCLGVVQIQCPREKSQQEFIGQVIRSAIRKSKFSKFSKFGLCGCDVPRFNDDQRDNRSNCSISKEQVSASTPEGQEVSEFNESYWNEADFNFTSTSFVNSGWVLADDVSEYKENFWDEADFISLPRAL